MASLFTALLAFSAVALAQQTQEIVWSAVTYTYHGEKTPALLAGPYDLTPVGANQLYAAGSILRDRYISGVSNSSIVSPAPINGMNLNQIDNDQLLVLATNDQWVSASATAFMQGLYPPFDSLTFDLESLLGDSGQEEYPLNGYQYPNVQTLSILDFNYLWIAGADGCNNYDVVNVQSLSSPAYVEEMQATIDFYQSLANSVFWAFSPDDLNYGNAWVLWEYAAFEYEHNETLVRNSSFTTNDLDTLFNLASAQQFGFNSPTSNGTLQAMAGRTYASFVIQELQHQVNMNGTAAPLTLLFGSFEPMVAFFALSNLATGPSASRFNSLPLHGSVMTFELYSIAPEPLSQNETIPFPNTSDLMVRFLFRNGTDSDLLTEYALFGRGNSEDNMSWDDFVTDMGAFSLNDLVDWCLDCQSGSLFCESLVLNYDSELPSGSGGSKKAKALSPAVAGVVGATVALAVTLIIGAILALLGFRLDYRPREKGDLNVLKRSGSGGGFKGAEKLASDTDLTMKGGAGASIVRHERVGSWELNEGPDKKISALDKDIESGRGMNKSTYGRPSEDGFGGVNPYGEPVKALDAI